MRRYGWMSRLLIWLWLTTIVLAQTLPGDKEAKEGNYPAALQLYRQAESQADPANRRRLLCRQLAVAQAVNDVLTARTVSEKLEAELRAADDPEVAMRLYLLKGAIAYRTKNLAGSRAAFEKAHPLAQRLAQQGDPNGALGLYECLTYEFLIQAYRQGRPTPQEYQQGCTAAYLASQNPPASAQKPPWPMDIYRSMQATRYWIWHAWEYSFLCHRAEDLAKATEWGNLSWGIGQNGAKILEAAYQATHDPEFLSAWVHIVLELAEDYPLAPNMTQALQQCQSAFAAMPDTLETRFIRGRYARAWARTRFYALNRRSDALKDYLQAADWFARGQRPVDQMDILLEMGYLYTLEGAPADWSSTVQSKLNELLGLSEKYSYANGRHFAQGFLGVLKAREGDLAGAESLLRQSLRQVAEWGRITQEGPVARAQVLARPEVRLFSDTLVDVLLKQNRRAEAMEASQGIHAAAESAALDLTRVRTRDSASAQDLKQLEQARTRNGQLQAELQSAQLQGDQATVEKLQGLLANNRAEFERTVNRMRQREPEFERLLSVRPSSFAKIQPQLPPEVVLVEYYTSEDRLVIFAATQKELQIHSVPVGRKQLEGWIRGFRARVMSRNESESLAGDLYQALVTPLEPLIAQHKVLTVIPSGHLYYLPFAALKKPGGECLNQRVAVSLLTATELPDVGRYKRTDKPTSVLALANPDGSLPATTKEVSQLTRLFSKSATYVGEQATKDRVNGSSQVLHVATHGVLDSHDVNESYLLLAGRNGKLTAGEIFGLDLRNVSLVTLSACETALGESNPGSEVATLAQAFSVAGSKSMLASLWQVEDEATAALMVGFYTQLLTGKTKAEALRLAQMEVMKNPRWARPYFWAAFELIGDWN